MATITDGTSEYRWSSLINGSTVATGKVYIRGTSVKNITIHSMAGNDLARTYADKLKAAAQRISYNYIIDSDGNIWGCIPEQYGSISSNNKDHDRETINIIVAVVNNNGEVTQEAWNSLVALSSDISVRYGFELNYTGDKNGTITTHRMFSSDTDCPGEYLTNQLSQLSDEANNKSTARTSPSSSGNSSDNSSSTTTATTGDAASKVPAGVINLEFSYGYNDGQMSEVHRGFMTEYDVNFNAYGSTLTIEGVSTEFISFKDPKSVTYKGMTVEEIIKSIADEEGWIIDDDSIEPIAEIEESTVYSLTTGSGSSLTNIYDDSNSSNGSNSGGTIQDGFINEAQKRVIQSTNKVSFQGTGWCAMWVSHVFQAAGFGYPGGNADDMYYSWCNSTDRSALKPGMIVAVAPSGATGNVLGHVGIYIGNSIVRHNSDHVQDSSLDDWIASYGPDGSHPHSNPVKWGWMEGRDLTQEN